MSSARAQSSSMASGSDVIQHSPSSGQAVDLPSQQFLTRVLRPRIDSADFSALVTSAAPAYDTFIMNINAAKSDILRELTALLNELSAQYQDYFDLRANQVFQFADIPTSTLSLHPDELQSSTKPQIIAASRRVIKSWTKASQTNTHTTIAFHHVAAGVFLLDEDKLDNGPMDFIWSLLKARPDLAGTVTMSITRHSWEYIYADPSSAYSSGTMAWNHSKAAVQSLVGFVHRVHTPFADSTVTLERDAPQPKPIRRNVRYPIKPFHVRAPVWLVRDNNDKQYRVTEVLAVGEPLLNGNWVAAATQHRTLSPQPSEFEDCPRTVIKDFWCALAKEHLGEDIIMRHVHGEGQMAGVCPLVDSFVVFTDDGTLHTADIDQGIPFRRKHRLILDGTSTDIYRCSSALRFLVVAYMRHRLYK